MHRRHDIDALRVLAFALLIFYHLGMLYVAPRSSWQGMPLHSAHQAEWLQYPMLFVNRWRMELLFMISGLAVHFLRARLSVGRLASRRTLRLLLPLVFGMLIVIPIQPYVQAATEGAALDGFGPFLWRYWSGGRAAGLTWAHLWYLPYLWLYTMLWLILLPALESRIGERLRRQAASVRGAALLLLPAAPWFAAGMWLHRYRESHALIGDWYAHAIYACAFFYGYLLGTDSGLWQELSRLRRRALACALLCFALYILLDKFGDALVGVGPWSPQALQMEDWLIAWLRYVYAWLAIVSVLGWGHAWLNRPFRWLPYAREAVYPWYILHQSLMLFFAWELLPLNLGPVAEPLLIFLSTVGGCALLHECMIRRIRPLRPLFGLENRQAPRETALPRRGVSTER